MHGLLKEVSQHEHMDGSLVANNENITKLES